MSLLSRLRPRPSPEPSPLLRPDGTPYQLVLYKYDACPFCRRVLGDVSRLGIEVELRDTLRDPSARADLREHTGRTQVPCLFVDGEPMFESADISRWLREQRSPAR